MAPPKDTDEPRPFTVSMDTKEIPCTRTGEGLARLIFTHGAGGTITSDGITNFAAGFSRSKRSSIICFQGNMNLKSRAKMFDAVHDATISTYVRDTPVALGGRSMGARAAVLAAMNDTKCLILASYPLQTDKEVRDQILLDLPADKDVLFISGDDDAMCDLEKLNGIRKKMNAKTWLIRVRDGDHGMNIKPKKATKLIGEETGSLAEEWLSTRRELATELEVRWEEHEQGRGSVGSSGWVKATGSTQARKIKDMPPNSKKGKNEDAAELKKSAKTSSLKSKKIEHDEENPRPQKRAKVMLSRNGKPDNTTRELETTSNKQTEPGHELRRSQREKTNFR